MQPVQSSLLAANRAITAGWRLLQPHAAVQQSGMMHSISIVSYNSGNNIVRAWHWEPFGIQSVRPVGPARLEEGWLL